MNKAISLILLGFPAGIAIPSTALAWNTGSNVNPKLFAQYKEEPNYPHNINTVKDKWTANKNSRSNVGLETGRDIIETLKDYSLRIQNGTCNFETGWFLDYIIPEDPNSYPTTWYIATGMGLLGGYKFEENKYGQIAPVPKKECEDAKLTLFRASPNNQGDDTDYDILQWKTKDMGQEKAEYWYDVSSNAHKSDPYEFMTFSPTNPNLFYVPINYLGNDQGSWNTDFPNPNYAGNLAVIEVKFDNEIEAKAFTNNFYGKYDHAKGSKSNKAINFFSKPLLEGKTNEEIVKEDDNYFLFSYPKTGLKRGTGNFRSLHKWSNKLGFYGDVLQIKDEEILGHVNLNKSKNKEIQWGNKSYSRRGYGYAIDLIQDPEMAGSLVIDSKRNVLGVLSKWKNEIDPLRNKELTNDFGAVINPKYDLLEGTDNQETSYKSQIQKYVLSENKKTNLSVARSWPNIKKR